MTVSEWCLIKLLLCILFEKIYLHFSIGNGQPREPSALCQLYRHTFVTCWLHNILWPACAVGLARVSSCCRAARPVRLSNNLSMFRLQIFRRRQSRVVENPIHTADPTRRDATVSGGRRCELATWRM